MHAYGASKNVYIAGVFKMGKRKYMDFVSTEHQFNDFPQALQGYQVMNNEECKQKLLDALDNKSSCVKFRDRQEYLPTCHNMVTTMHVKSSLKKIDLAKVARCTGNSSYDRKRFAAITLRIDNPKTTALLFSSGKVVITGATSRQMSIYAARGIIKMLRRLFPDDEFEQTCFAIQNIVSNVSIPNVSEIDVKRMYQEHASHTTYQPSIFPGLIFRPSGSPVVLLIFKSSRIVVTGAKRYEDVYSGFKNVLDDIKKYFVYDTPAT